MSFYPAKVLHQWEGQTDVPSARCNGLFAVDLYWTDAEAAASGVAVVHAAVNGSTAGAGVEVTTGFNDMPAVRNVTATAGGTAGDIAAVQVIVEGTNYLDEAISETLPAFTLNTAGTVTGSKAFKTVTKYTIPTMDGTGATVSIGTGDKLGLPFLLNKNTVLDAWLNNVREGTAPTVATSAADIEANTVDLNSALNGTAVSVALLVPS